MMIATEDMQDQINARELVRKLAMAQRLGVKMAGASYAELPDVAMIARITKPLGAHVGRELTENELDAAAVLYRHGHALFAIAHVIKLAESVS